MKSFNPSFFAVENFLQRKETFDCLPEQARDVCHIAFNVNDAYVKMAGVTCISVLENNKDMYFTFHIFTDGCSDENLERIRQVAEQWQCRCIVYILHIEPFLGFHIKVKRFVKITYARLYMPKILKAYTSRYIYMDSDMMCIASLQDVWHMDLQGKAIAAASELPHTVADRSAFLKLKTQTYFNSGFMVIDIPAWEKGQITERAFSYQGEPPARFLGHDQDVINLVVDGDIVFLPRIYNQLGGDTEENDRVIIHWTGRRKPWLMVLTRFDEQWRHYLDISPWDGITNIEPIKKPENYHDFKQWGKIQRSRGNRWGYFVGLFWYSWLRIRYKLNI